MADGVILIHKETGEQVLVPNELAERELATGAYEVAEGETLSVIDPDLDIRIDAPVDEALGRFSEQGYGVEANEAQRHRERRDAILEQHGGTGATALTAAEGFASGFTAGTSDVISRLTLRDDPEALEALRARTEANPIARTGGEIGGVVAGALVGAKGGGPKGGAGAALSAIPSVGIQRLGSFAGQRVAARLGSQAAGGAVRGALAKGAGVAAQGVVEGGLFGFGQGVTELALSDQPLTLESAVATLGSNTLAGAGIGGAAGVGLKAAGGATRALTRQGGKLGRRMLDKASPGLNPATREGKAIEKAVREQLEQLDETARVALRDADDMLKSQDIVNKFLDDGAPAATSLDDVAIAQQGRMARVNDAARQVRNAVDEFEKIGREAFEEEVGAGVRRRGKRIKILDINANKATRQAYAEAVEELGLSTRKLLGEIAPEQKVLPGFDDMLATVARESGEETASLLQRINALDVAAAADLAGVDISGLPGGEEASLFLKFYAAGRAGQIAGGKSKTVKAAVGKLRDVVGPAVRSDALGSAAGIMGALGKNTGRVLTTIEKGVDKFLSAAKPAVKVAPSIASVSILGEVRYGDTPKAAAIERRKGESTMQRDFRRRRRELIHAISDPRGIEAQVRDSLGELNDRAPRIADEMVVTHMRKLAFLAEKMPKNPGIRSHFGGSMDDYTPSRSEVAKFARYAAAAEDPLGVLRDMDRGQVTPEQVEAVREVYPAMFARMQEAVIAKAGELKAKLPYQKLVQLSIMFDVPVDSTMRPEFIAALQANFAEQQPREQGPNFAPSRLGDTLAANLQTQAERIAAR